MKVSRKKRRKEREGRKNERKERTKEREGGKKEQNKEEEKEKGRKGNWERRKREYVEKDSFVSRHDF